MFVEQVKRTMAAFAVISVSINTALDDAIASVYEGKALRISPTVQLVADVGVTTEEVSTKLGVKPGGIGGTWSSR